MSDDKTARGTLTLPACVHPLTTGEALSRDGPPPTTSTDEKKMELEMTTLCKNCGWEIENRGTGWVTVHARGEMCGGVMWKPHLPDLSLARAGKSKVLSR